MRLILRQSKSSTTKNVRYDWNKLLTDSNIKELYTGEVYNRFKVFQDIEEDVNSSNTIYNCKKNTYKEAAKRHIPVKNKIKQHLPRVNNDIVEKRSALFETLDYPNSKKTRSSEKKLDDARIKLEEAYVKEQ